MDQFLIEVDELCRNIHKKTDYLNSGGCAVFAALLGQCLSQYGQVEIAIGTDSNITSLDDVRDKGIDPLSLDAWNDNGLSIGHAIIEFTYGDVKYHIDSTGVRDPLPYTYSGGWGILGGRLSVIETTALAAQRGWNWMFNRDQIPTIKQMIDHGFAKMFKKGMKPTIG